MYQGILLGISLQQSDFLLPCPFTPLPLHFSHKGQFKAVKAVYYQMTLRQLQTLILKVVPFGECILCVYVILNCVKLGRKMK